MDSFPTHNVDTHEGTEDREHARVAEHLLHIHLAAAGLELGNLGRKRRVLEQLTRLGVVLELGHHVGVVEHLPEAHVAARAAHVRVHDLLDLGQTPLENVAVWVHLETSLVRHHRFRVLAKTVEGRTLAGKALGERRVELDTLRVRL